MLLISIIIIITPFEIIWCRPSRTHGSNELSWKSKAAMKAVWKHLWRRQAWVPTPSLRIPVTKDLLLLWRGSVVVIEGRLNTLVCGVVWCEEGGKNEWRKVTLFNGVIHDLLGLLFPYVQWMVCEALQSTQVSSLHSFKRKGGSLVSSLRYVRLTHSWLLAHTQGHFTHKTEGPWPLQSKSSHWSKGRRPTVQVHFTHDGEGLKAQRQRLHK